MRNGNGNNKPRIWQDAYEFCIFSERVHGNRVYDGTFECFATSDIDAISQFANACDADLVAGMEFLGANNGCAWYL